MSDRERIRKPDSDELLEEIFRHASPRPRPRQEARERAYASLHATWREQTGRRRARHRAIGWIAAGLVVLAGASLILTSGTSPPAPLQADILRASGDLVINGEHLAQPALPRTLEAGDRLETPDGAQVAIAFGGGSLRLDGNTQVHFPGSQDIALARGTLYFDSRPFGGPKRKPGSVVVTTAFGRITHAGTQFLAAVDDDGLAVSVREGRVGIAGDATDIPVRRGESVRFTTASGWRREAVSSYDDRWQWVADIAPEVALDGRTTREILDWVARETGRRVRYASGEARAIADSEARGLGALAPVPALRTIPVMTSLEVSLDSGAIVVDVAPPTAER